MSEVELIELATSCFIFVGRFFGIDGKLGGGNSKIFYFHPYLGKILILTNIFQMG